MSIYPVSVYKHMSKYCHVTVPIQQSKMTINIISITTWKCTTIIIACIHWLYLLESLTNLLKYYYVNSNFVNLLCFMQRVLYHFHYDTRIIKLESLLAYLYVVESSESSYIGPLHLSQKIPFLLPLLTNFSSYFL